ncbi:hypothetical protein METBIDRAFT_96745 [Metschnikowia bicuspidata var. bicuspidata NRRL YB-4993]|uniref:Uncharacterized protein n=1 Tax=Metschnikowia bicuspidata var. bicuspidata NRRL YB-4993 TaxID=869754 RepID=A0A1A0HGA0_9ASCO|nr:hypothetical protein METBIDRAFT_96745 [Metschnikowia bicuspidata var. bicuspidata NRRL YB-4993]OBA23031.1 hypothetical protein METBIDRAFT_96745 [Metschnikowia bicuspidata var. bicuspidata NRRL YB-4993]
MSSELLYTIVAIISVFTAKGKSSPIKLYRSILVLLLRQEPASISLSPLYIGSTIALHLRTDMILRQSFLWLQLIQI